MLAATLAGAAARFPNAPVRLSSRVWVAAGLAFTVFGWTYPHFLETDSWTSYLYAAPFGLLPCPTLSSVIGMTLLFENLRSRVWSTALVVAGLVYGAVGVFQLGVALDWGLLFASALLAAVIARDHKYGRIPQVGDAERDELLDRFMPVYEVVERHDIHVAAPASLTLAAAREQDLLQLPLVRAIFKAREVILRATPDDRPQPRGLVAATQALGWGILADVPDREIVVGAVTRPWEPNVTFRALPPDDFAGFSEPGFVKIAWTLRADPVGEGKSIFRTETRAVATDASARAQFRRYWAFASPGIALIRRLSLRPLKRDAERRAC
jgi:hypothetical protein